MANTPEDFSYVNGENKFRNLESKIDAILFYLSSSYLNNNPSDTAQVVTLTPFVGALPTAPPSGSIALSGSGAAMKLYVYNAAGSTSGWATGSILA